jgi:hypothetical protein
VVTQKRQRTTALTRDLQLVTGDDVQQEHSGR